MSSRKTFTKNDAMSLIAGIQKYVAHEQRLEKIRELSDKTPAENLQILLYSTKYRPESMDGGCNAPIFQDALDKIKQLIKEKGRLEEKLEQMPPPFYSSDLDERIDLPEKTNPMPVSPELFPRPSDH